MFHVLIETAPGFVYGRLAGKGHIQLYTEKEPLPTLFVEPFVVFEGNAFRVYVSPNSYLFFAEHVLAHVGPKILDYCLEQVREAQAYLETHDEQYDKWVTISVAHTNLSATHKVPFKLGAPEDEVAERLRSTIVDLVREMKEKLPEEIERNKKAIKASQAALEMSEDEVLKNVQA